VQIFIVKLVAHVIYFYFACISNLIASIHDDKEEKLVKRTCQDITLC